MRINNSKIRIAIFSLALTAFLSCNKIKDFEDTDVNPADISTTSTFSEYALNPAAIASSVATLVPAADLQESRYGEINKLFSGKPVNLPGSLIHS